MDFTQKAVYCPIRVLETKKFIGKQVMNLLWEVCIRYTSRTEKGLSCIDIVLYYLKKPKITFKFTVDYEVKFYA